jgi:uncharacterized membrane protein HdeD (DUF308 family)
MLKKSKNEIVDLLVAIIFLIIGALLFTNPDAIIAGISYTLGTIMILLGIFTLIKNYYKTKADSNTPVTELTFGIIMIVIGIMFLLLAGAIGVAIRYVFGAWMIFSGINRLMVALQIDRSDKNFIVQLVVSILLLAGGLYTILRANLTFQIIGIIMMIYAVLEIVGFISNKESGSNKTTTEEKIDLAIEHNKDNGDDVKDATIVEDKTDDTKKNKKKKKK